MRAQVNQATANAASSDLLAHGRPPLVRELRVEGRAHVERRGPLGGGARGGAVAKALGAVVPAQRGAAAERAAAGVARVAVDLAEAVHHPRLLREVEAGARGNRLRARRGGIGSRGEGAYGGEAERVVHLHIFRFFVLSALALSFLL